VSAGGPLTRSEPSFCTARVAPLRDFASTTATGTQTAADWAFSHFAWESASPGVGVSICFWSAAICGCSASNFAVCPGV
jgi:hypothetical protein